MCTHKIDLDQLLVAYLECAVWADLDESDTKINTEFTKEAKSSALADIKLFVSKCVETFGADKAAELLTISNNQAGHDFWLNRNGHGSGFWDKPEIYGYDEADILSDICKSFREVELMHVNTMRSKLTFY